MSYNPNFYNNFCGNNSATFQSLPPICVPPPPPPPAFFIPLSTPANKRVEADQEFLKNYESKIPIRELTEIKVKPLSISEVREEMRKMVLMVNDLKSEEKILTDNISSFSDEEWNTNMKKVEENKILINKTLSQINGPYLDMLRKLLAKRSAKRLRLKNVRLEKKREKEDRIKEMKERSRRIDENLQKIQDDINKAKQEEEEKIQADIVLKEVLRKKSDAKKCITKLDALIKLRKARQNTAKGRGENVSESDAAAFNSNLEKLKSLWAKKLILYQKEETDLRAQLKVDSEQQDSMNNKTEKQVASNLEEWRRALFGGQLPQVDFRGDIARFVAVRSSWDRYISSEGTAIPMGWVPPTPKSDDKAP